MIFSADAGLLQNREPVSTEEKKEERYVIKIQC